MSNDRDDRDDHNDEPEDRGGERIATATRDHSASTDREPMLTDTGAKTKDPADIKLAPPKSVGDHKDGVLTEDFKEPKGHEIGGLDDVAEGPGRALHEDLTSQIDQVGAHETLMDAPGADLLQGRDGGLPEGVASMPGGGHDTSGLTTTQESPIDMFGPGGTGGSSDGKPGSAKPGSYDKPGKEYLDKTVDIGSKEAAKDGASFAKFVQGFDKDRLKAEADATKAAAAEKEKAAEAAEKEKAAEAAEKEKAAAAAAAEKEEAAEKDADADAKAQVEAEAEKDSDAGDVTLNHDPSAEKDEATVMPTDPEYDGPMGISGVQTEAFKNEHLQSQWNAKQDSTINPNPSSDASLEQVEMVHAMDDMVTTPADATAGGPPKIDTGTPLAGGNQPIDFGPDHIEPGGGSGPYDGNLGGELLHKVPKVSQSTGGNTSTTDDDKPIVATTNKMTKDAPEEAPDKDAEKGPMQKEHTPDETPDKYDTAESADTQTVDPGRALGDWDGVVTGGDATVVAGGGDESGAGQSKFDHSATASASPDAAVTEYGAGHVLEPKPAFGQGDVSSAAPGPLPGRGDGGAGDSQPWDPNPESPHFPDDGRDAPTDGEAAGSGLQVTELPTTDDTLLVRRSSDSDDSGDDAMEYDPGLEPLE